MEVVEGRAAVASAVFSSMAIRSSTPTRPRQSVALQIARKPAPKKAHQLRRKGLYGNRLHRCAGRTVRPRGGCVV